MKIIKEGNILSSTRRFTCKHCGCIFECNDSEYSRETACINITHYTAVCPTCGMKLYKSEEIGNSLFMNL